MAAATTRDSGPQGRQMAMLGAGYLGQSFAIRRRRAMFAGNLRNTYGGATRWDLLLRSDLDAERVVRVPRVLSHVRQRRQGVNADGVRVVQEAPRQPWSSGTAELAEHSVRLRWQLESWPHVTVVIPTRHNRPMLSRVLPGLAATDYPSFDVRIVDNGGESTENAQWYTEHDNGLDLQVQWWTETPFNYSRVNNAAAAGARGDVLIFLNDDIELPDASWLRELVGWASRPEIGVAGLQLTQADGKIQHAGVVLGMGGFADHVFAGCRARIRFVARTDRLVPQRARGHRSLRGDQTPAVRAHRWFRRAVHPVRQRCRARPRHDPARLPQRVLAVRRCAPPRIGDPRYARPARGLLRQLLALQHLDVRRRPVLLAEPVAVEPQAEVARRIRADAGQRIAGPIGRDLQVFRQRSDAAESTMLADTCRVSDVDVAAIANLHATNAARLDVKTINWYIPDIDSPFYGGINTALRMADYLARNHGVENRFVVWGSPPDFFVRSAITAAFPSLADSDISFFDGPDSASLELVPPADASIATLWLTAYAVARAQNTKRKFYLVQDFEPMFYPASTSYALAEETYRLGLYALCNTENLRQIYADDYGGKGMSFMPAIDPSVFHAHDRPFRSDEAPTTVFVYARPGHWRNCWELASLALRELKERLGDGVRVVPAGS